MSTILSFSKKIIIIWEITKPIKTLADTATVNEVLHQIASAQPLRVIPVDGSDKDQANLKEWGLAPAAERVVIHTKDDKDAKGQMYELLVGRKTAINDNVYARTSGRKKEPVRIIPNSVKVILQKDLSDFRSHNVFDFEVSKATKIASRTASIGTATPAQEYEEVDLKDRKWTLQKPIVARGIRRPMCKIFSLKYLALRATNFVTDAPKQSQPVWIDLSKRNPIRFTVRQPRGCNQIRGGNHAAESAALCRIKPTNGLCPAASFQFCFSRSLQK